MDPIGITQPIIISALPSQSSALAVQAAPQVVLPTSNGTSNQVNYDPQAAEQAHAQTVQHVAQQIANDYVLGDQTFTIFKDITGQYITRFTSLRDGKVTYVPQPTLFKLGESFAPDTAGLLKVDA